MWLKNDRLTALIYEHAYSQDLDSGPKEYSAG